MSQRLLQAEGAKGNSHSQHNRIDYVCFWVKRDPGRGKQMQNLSALKIKSTGNERHCPRI